MEVIMVVIAMTLGAVFGMTVAYCMDKRYMDELTQMWIDDVSQREATFKQRERMIINRYNQMQTQKVVVLDPPKEVVEQIANEISNAPVWFDVLSDVSEPVEDNGINYGGF